MNTLVQFVPKWLQDRLRKPAQPKTKALSKRTDKSCPHCRSRAAHWSSPRTTVLRDTEFSGGRNRESVGQKKGASNETSYPLPEPIALPKEL